jgi:hypothetical protein
LKFITPKNWSDFQHYKDRSPVWIKLHRKILDNRDFHRLPVASRALAPMLWLLASEYDGGEIPLDYDLIAFRLRMTEVEAQEALTPLIDKEFFVVVHEASATLAECLPREEKSRDRERVETEKKKKSARATPDGYSAEFEEAWRVYPKRPGANKKASFKAWSARIASGVEPQLMLTGSARYAAYCAANNTDPQYIKQPATFFGPDHHYLSDWTPTNSTGKQQGNNGRKTIHEQRAETIAALTGRNKPQQHDAFSAAIDVTPTARQLD